MNKEELRSKFEFQLANNVIEMKKYGRFSQLQRILDDKGYFEGAKMLVNKSDTSGLRDLLLANRKDLSIEHLVLLEEFQPLFTQDEITKCKRKLGVK